MEMIGYMADFLAHMTLSIIMIFLIFRIFFGDMFYILQ